MKIRKTNFENLLIIESKAHFDERGVFIESLRQNILKDAINQSINFVQENIVRSKKMCSEDYISKRHLTHNQN